jgi:hypothetical protein
VEHLFTHLLQGLLNLFGMDQKQQVFWVVLVLLAWLVVWALRSRDYGRVFSWLFVFMGVSLTLVLFSESPAVRWVGLAIFMVSSVAGFAWNAIRARRTGAR